eukprot:6184737-Pleurochrysis_carterae.AAC.3
MSSTSTLPRASTSHEICDALNQASRSLPCEREPNRYCLGWPGGKTARMSRIHLRNSSRTFAGSDSQSPAMGKTRVSQSGARDPFGRRQPASCSRKWKSDTCLAQGLRTNAKE